MIRNRFRKGRRTKSRTEFGVLNSVTSMEGSLLKFVNVVKGWQQRYFVLQFGVLSYYVDASDKSERKRHGGGGAWTESVTESNEQQLQRHRSQSHNVVSTPKKPGDGSDLNRATSMTPPAPALLTSTLDEQGTPSTKGVLTSGTPKSAGGTRRRKYRGSINMQFAVVSKDDSDPCRFALDCGTTIYHLKAPSEAERDAWVAALNESKMYHESIVTRAEMRTLSKGEIQDKLALVEMLDASKAATVASGAAPHAAQEDDTGLREAMKSHNALLAELRRIQEVASMARFPDKAHGGSSLKEDQVECRRVMDQAFAPDGESPDPRAVVQGLCDLMAWSINVLDTENQLWSMQAKAVSLNRAVAQSQRKLVPAAGRSVVVGGPAVVEEEQEEDEESSDDEFFDIMTNAAMFQQLAASADVPGPDIGKEEANSGALAELEIHRIATIDLGKSVADSTMRSRIPKPAQEMARVSVWSFLKNCIGKDLSKIAMPVVFNEPLSFLQRMTEDVEYSELLDRAAECDDERERILLVAAMALSHYSSTMERLGKPFNPLLAETYELVSPVRRMRVIAEQVSHHPPISSIHVEGHESNWTYRSNIEVRNVFFGKSLEVRPTGWNHVYLKKYDAHYTYFQPTTCVHNIVVGSLWVDNYGDLIVKEHRTGVQLHVTLYKSGWMSDKKLYASVVGEVVDKKGKRMKAKIGGRWDSVLRCEIDGKTKTLWKANPRPPKDHSADFNMTQWAIGLNTPVPSSAISEIAPTDSRFRPDQRLLEQAMVDEATSEKLRLEAKQRKRRKEYEELNKAHAPRWFKKEFDPDIGEEDWKFTGEYWQCKQNRAWPGCLDIFSESPDDPTASLSRSAAK